MSTIVVTFWLSFVGRTELIDSVVGQVHEMIIHVSCRGLFVGLGTEPGEALFMNIDSHWTDCIDIHIYPQIVLQVVNQVRLV